jgi:lysophospholipase L1-like esterase
MKRTGFAAAALVRLLAPVMACLLAVGCDDSPPNGDQSDNDDDGNVPVIVAMGDSITEGSEIRGPSYPEILGERIGFAVYNEGVGGYSSVRVAGLLDDAFRYYHPNYVLIMCGTIDVWWTERYEDVIGSLDYMVQYTRENGATPVVATIAPRYSDDRYLEDLHTELNRRIRRFASDVGVYLVDVESAFRGRPDLIQDDGVHPTDAGTAVIADLFFDALVALGVVTP